MQKSRFRKRANISSNDFSLRNQQICTNIIGIVWIIRYDVTKTFDSLSRVFFQIKILLFLNVIVLLINIIKDRGNLHFHNFAGFRFYLPAKTLQIGNSLFVGASCCRRFSPCRYRLIPWKQKKRNNAYNKCSKSCLLYTSLPARSNWSAWYRRCQPLCPPWQFDCIRLPAHGWCP